MQCNLQSGTSNDTFISIKGVQQQNGSDIPRSALTFELDMTDPGTISATFPKMTSLHLYMSAIEFPIDLFKTLPALQLFNGTQNYLQIIGADMFTKSTKLKILDLTRNDVRSIQNTAFSGLGELQYLLLAENLLTEIKTSAFDGLYNVEGIDLCANLINTIHDGAFNLANLKTVLLQNNRVYTLTDGAFSGRNKLKVIDLSGNPLMFSNRAFANCDKLAILGLCKTVHLTDEELVVSDSHGVSVYRTDDECEHEFLPPFFEP